MTKKQDFIYHLHGMLLRYHRYLGMSLREYVLLHTCIQFDDLYMIEDITGLTEDQIVMILSELMERKVIHFNENNEIDLKKLYQTLKQIERSALPFRDMLIREYQGKDRSYGEKHVGHVELVPMKEGVAVLLQNGMFLSLHQTKELIEELESFVLSMKGEELQPLNMEYASHKELGKKETS